MKMKFRFSKFFQRGIILCLGIGLIIALAITAKSQHPKNKKGLVTYTDGRVKKKEVDQEEWKNAAKDTSVLTGDRVRTFQKSRAELELLDLDIIRMAPETVVDIVKLYEETKSKIKETQISVEKGDIWANINKKKENSKFNISAPVAVAAITGTVLRIGVDTDSTTELKVYNGEVRITNAPEKTDLSPKSIGVHEVPGPYEVPGPRVVSMEEWVYIVKNMQKIVVDKKGQVKEVGEFTAHDQDEQTKWVKWNLQRDRINRD